ncbi:MAG: hypothetical protein ACYC9O_09185 [Candidatus Latescibacterota bacterium]
MFRRIIPLAFAVLLAFAATAETVELGLSSFSLSAGRTYRKADFPPSGNMFYPEVKAGGPLFLSLLHWGVSWGYWNENKGLPADKIQLSDSTVPGESRQGIYSYSGHVLGARLTVFPHRSSLNPVTVGLFAGASRHFLRERSIRSTPGGQRQEIHTAPGFSTFDLGVTAFVRLLGPFSLVSELRLLQPLDDAHDRYDAYRNRLAFTVGAAYFPK